MEDDKRNILYTTLLGTFPIFNNVITPVILHTVLTKCMTKNIITCNALGNIIMKSCACPEYVCYAALVCYKPYAYYATYIIYNTFVLRSFKANIEA